MIFVGVNLYSQHADDFLTYAYNEKWIANENIKLITVKEYNVNNRYKVKMTKRNCILSKFYYDKNGNIILIERADWKQPFTIDTTGSIIKKCSWTICYSYLKGKNELLKKKYTYDDTTSYLYDKKYQVDTIISQNNLGDRYIKKFYYNKLNKIDSSLTEYFEYGKTRSKIKGKYNYYDNGLLKSVFFYNYNLDTGNYKLYRKIIYEYNEKGFPSKKDYINLELDEPFIESIELYFYEFY
jgi:hypothetical protein